jgi:beta-N-acetylhexosaminidase
MLAPSPHSPTPAAPAVDVEALLKEMSLEEKIGQLVMTGIPGAVYGPEAARLVEDLHVGSVVYFADNTRTAEQTLKLSQALQTAAQSSGRGIPLFIAVDHEGGRVFRFQQGLTHFPSLMALGATNAPDLALQTGLANASELKAVGVNVSLGPVLDVNSEALNPVIGLRSLGDDPQRVSVLGAAYLDGLQQGGVIAAVKHYPGHGATQDDSHDQLPVLSATLDELLASELLPFQTAIQSGTGMVMVGHLAFPAIDPSGRPATLSPVLVTDVLRGRLGFQGVIITDAMSMGAILQQASPEQAALLAVQAGCDILAYNDSLAARNAVGALLQAAQDGRLAQERIDASVRRVLLLKAQYGLFSTLPVGGPIAYEQDLELARQIARRSIAVTGPAQAPLLASSSVLLITPDSLSSGALPGDGSSYLGDLLLAQGLAVDEWIYTPDAPGKTAALQRQILQAAADAPAIVFVTWDAALADARGDTSQVRLLNALLDTGKPLILVAGSSPYDLGLDTETGVGVAMFGGLDVQVEALAQALTSPTLPGGVMPVRVR